MATNYSELKIVINLISNICWWYWNCTGYNTM